MQISSLIALCCVSFWTEVVFAEGENEVKRGLFPFMAFLYYPDETVVDASGARFLRGAVLIKPEWLLSSAIDHSVLDNVPLGFPRKTLLARAGAIAIDANFTLNEDEDEQEREVIQIVRPGIHNVEVWWFTDITLLKTLLPFNLSSAVSFTTINPKREYIDKNCAILIYAKRYGNATEDRNLMQLSVDLMPATIDNCGNQFSETGMTCAVDSDETKNAPYDPDFCQGNSGGPLMCEGEVMGLQTYIDNNCKQPHLYQLLISWESLISCGTKEKCQQDYCNNICSTTNKDAPVTELTVSPTHPLDVPSTTTTELTEASELTTEATTKITITTTLSTTEASTESSTEMSTEESEPTTTTPEMTETQTSTTKSTTKSTTTTTESTTQTTTVTTDTPVHWPNEKRKSNLRKMDRPEETEVTPERTAKMEAQQQQVVQPRARSAAERHMCLIQSLILGVIVLICAL